MTCACMYPGCALAGRCLASSGGVEAPRLPLTFTEWDQPIGLTMSQPASPNFGETLAEVAAGGACGAGNPEPPAWVARKAEFDAMDDGCGPYMEWAWKDEDEQARRRTYWPDFLAWAEDHMGQGYSLACCEGSLVDPITSYCFHGYVVGREKERHG